MRNIILILFLFTLVSSNKFLKREALPEELDDVIILQKGSRDRCPSSSIPRTNVNHVIVKPINPTKLIINPGIKNRPKNYGNQDISTIRRFLNRPISSRRIQIPNLDLKPKQKNQGINNRPKKYANQDIPIIKPYGLPKINVRSIRPPCQSFKCEQKNHDKNNRSKKPSRAPIFIRTTRPPNSGMTTRRHNPKL